MTDDNDISAAGRGQPPSEPPEAPSPPQPDAVRPQRGWLPLIIVVAAVLIGDAAIAAAIIIGANRISASSSTEAATAIVAGPGCSGWMDARSELEAIPPLPTGWDWNTPNIDTLISNQQAAIKPVLDSFEQKMIEIPDDNIAPLAQKYIQAQRDNMDHQALRTASAIDVDRVISAYTWLNSACGLAG